MLRVACTTSRSVYSSITHRPTTRTFFASSTDHTQLLKESQVHRLPQDDGSTLYVMAAEGMDADTVQKVPQLHLARLTMQDNVIGGAKVVNRSLGSTSIVCAKLFDAALKDGGAGTRAKSMLHGLSEWVLEGIKDEGSVEAVVGLEKADLEALEAIAGGGGDLLVDEAVYAKGKADWERLAREYVEKGNGEEAVLYVSKGGKLVSVEHLADTSEFARESGGAMAIFSF